MCKVEFFKMPDGEGEAERSVGKLLRQTCLDLKRRTEPFFTGICGDLSPKVFYY